MASLLVIGAFNLKLHECFLIDDRFYKGFPVIPILLIFNSSHFSVEKFTRFSSLLAVDWMMMSPSLAIVFQCPPFVKVLNYTHSRLAN